MDNQAPKPGGGAADYSKYLVNSKAEVVYVLRAVMQKTELVTAYFNHGREFVLTSVVEVSDDHVILDYGANEALNRKLVEAGKVMFVTAQEKVRVQFSAPYVEKVSFEGQNAFRIPLPDSLLKLQRREYYRISTPISAPLKCEVPLPSGGKVDVTVVDISVGGVGIVGYPAGLDLEVGAVYPGCRIELPEVGTVLATLQIRSSFDVTLRSGAQTRRSGCQFLDLPSNMQVLLQRYIIKLERERRAKLAQG